MHRATELLHRVLAIVLANLLVFPFAAIASAQETPPAQHPQTASSTPATAPNKIAAAPAVEVASLPDSPVPQTAPAQQSSSPQTAPQPPQQQPRQEPNTPSQPMGTAAAPAEPVSGVSASRPAGAAIAPAKQKRTHTILIRMSILVGAAVAIGTVAALSASSPGRP